MRITTSSIKPNCMLTFKLITDVAQCAHYFADGDLDDYYAKESSGYWSGKGAEHLGLSGEVTTEAFTNVLKGRSADGTIQLRKLVPSQKNKTRAGIDFTFSAPKSVSIQALVSGDRRVIEAHTKAVSAATQEMEKMALALKSTGGIRFRQRTGNMVFANYRHELSRDQDPQLHTHAVAMNITKREDGAFVALTNDMLLKNVMTFGAIYRGELAAQLESIGYKLRSTRDGFELENISQQAIDAFSKRSRDIELALKKRQLTRETASPSVKQAITMATRKPKSPSDRRELNESWAKVLALAGTPGGAFDAPEKVAVDQVTLDVRHNELAQRAVEFAIAHLSERQGVFTHGELYQTAVNAALSGYSKVEDHIAKAVETGGVVKEIKLYQSAKSFKKEVTRDAKDFQAGSFKFGDDNKKMSRAGWITISKDAHGVTQEQAESSVDAGIAAGRLIEVETRYTTTAALRTEQAILDMEKVGRMTVVPVMSSEAAKEVLSKTNLNAGQREAATVILTSKNKFIGIQGYAGVGKSHALSKVVDVLEQSVAHAKGEGFEIIGVAPYASQNKALALLGMKSQTLASFLASEKDQARLGPKSIVLLDESSVVPAHQMLKIMSKIEETGARLVMVGDKQQTQAVESGKPFEQLQDAGMQLAHITEIVRQKNEVLKKAVEQASIDKIAESIETLKTRVREVPVEEKRHKLMAKDYVALPEEDRKKTLVVAGTNDARKSLNAEIRSQLAMTGGSPVDTFENFDMTRAEHRMAGSYKEGLLVMSEKPTQGALKRGQYYEVISVDATKNTLLLKNMSDNTTQTVDPRRVGDLSVYEPNQIELAQNDWVRITRNLKMHDLANGERYQVKSISDKEITLSNGVTLPTTERLHMQYGYVTTVHSAQGLTEDRVLIDANTKSLTSNKSVFYVAISRPRHELTIYTNDKGKLPESMARVPKKFAALDLRTESSDAAVVSKNLMARQRSREKRDAEHVASRAAPNQAPPHMEPRMRKRAKTT